jgi:uncharacterized coiled-coil protein SlyX
MFNLTNALNDLSNADDSLLARIIALENRVTTINNTLTQQIARINNLYEIATQLDNKITALSNRISAIENAIYNWVNDKNTKIPRGNINVTSGGYSSGNGIYPRATNTNEDLNFS